jgi:O-antigen/teichoic acid export membrane protein
MASVGRKIAFNSLVQIVGKAVAVAIGLITVKLLTNNLGVAGFGEYTTILNFLMMFGIVADLGLYVVLTTEIAHEDEQRTLKAISNIFTLRLVSAILIVIGLGSLVALVTPYSWEVKSLIVLGSFGMVFMSLAQVLVGIFQKNLRTDRIVIAETLARLFLMVSVVTLSLTDNFRLIWIILAFVGSNILQFSYVLFYARKYFVIKLTFDWPYWKYLLKAAFPLFVVITFNLIYYKIDTLMLSVLKTPEDVGLYGVAYKILELLAVFPGMFVGLLLPIFAKYYVADKKIFQDVFGKGFMILATLAVPLVVGGLLMSEKIILLISGPDYSVATPALRLLFVGIGFIFFSNLFSNVLIGAGLQGKIMFISITGAIFNVLLNLYLIPRFSYVGAAFATSMTEGLVLMLYMWQVYKYIQFLPKVSWQFMKVVFTSALMGVVLYYTAGLNIFLQALLGAITFGVVLYFSTGFANLKKEYVISVN